MNNYISPIARFLTVGTLVACLPIYPCHQGLAKELDGRVTETEFLHSDSGTTGIPVQHKAPSWFGAPVIDAPTVSPSAISPSDTQRRIVDSKTSTEYEVPGADRFLKMTPKEYERYNEKLSKEAANSSDLKRLAAVPETAWQTKYWDSWWHTFEFEAYRRAKIWLRKNDFCNYLDGSEVYLHVTIMHYGKVEAKIVSCSETNYANAWKNCYESLSYSRYVKFPPWSHRILVVEDSQWKVTRWGHCASKTGDYETVPVDR